jgi:hypothetical protein
VGEGGATARACPELGEGLSLVVASQQPSALDMEVLSQCDVIISHALTTSHRDATQNRLTKDYMGAELRVPTANKIARTEQAAFVDDDVERVTMVQIKPIFCRHVLRPRRPHPGFDPGRRRD